MPQMNAEQALQLADQNYRQGRLADAEAFCRIVLQQQPNNTGALSRLGLLAMQAGRPEAAQILQRALALAPNDANAHNNLGVVLQSRGQIEQAVGCFRNAVRIDPTFPQALTNLGNLLVNVGRLDEALEVLQRAVAASPTFPELHNNYGAALQARQRYADAIAAHRRAIAIQNNFPEAYFNLGNALFATRQLPLAEEAFRQAIALRKDYAEARCNLGMLLSTAGKSAEALDLLRGAIEIRPDIVQAHNSLGVLYKTLASFDQAEAEFREAIKLQSDYPEPHFNLAMLLLMTGRFEEGWNHWEWRWRTPAFPSPRRALDRPLWDGSPGPGAPGHANPGIQRDGARTEADTLLVHAEQGIGDTIQFSRYLPLLHARGWNVVFECQKELVGLFSDSFPGIRVIEWTGQDFATKLPPYDAQIPITSLPRALGVLEPESAPDGACLVATPERIERWKRLLVEADPQWHKRSLRVGLVWAGNPLHTNDHNRSMPLAMLAPLADERITFVSLQFGPPAAEAASPPPSMRLLDLTGQIADFTDSAAIVAQLDLVIAVDTAGLHLAGALGRQAWGMLPFIPDWRWRLDRDQTPWYPSLSLYRQPAAGQWAPLVARVARDLRQMADAQPPAQPASEKRSWHK